MLPETTDQTLEDLYEKANGNIEIAVNMFWENQTAEPVPDTKMEEPLFINKIEEQPEKKVLDRKGYYIGDMIVIGMLVNRLLNIAKIFINLEFM